MVDFSEGLVRSLSDLSYKTWAFISMFGFLILDYFCIENKLIWIVYIFTGLAVFAFFLGIYYGYIEKKIQAQEKISSIIPEPEKITKIKVSLLLKIDRHKNNPQDPFLVLVEEYEEKGLNSNVNYRKLFTALRCSKYSKSESQEEIKSFCSIWEDKINNGESIDFPDFCNKYNSTLALISSLEGISK